MTQNEKAATYLGWKAGERCDAVVRQVEFGDVWCLSCRQLFGCGTHDIPAPDMTKPENYMQALEAISRRTHHGPIKLEISHEDEEGWLVYLYKVLEEEYTVDWMQPVDALAALYDYEHADAAQ